MTASSEMIGPYRLGHALGQGRFGTVRIAEHVTSGQMYAVKVVAAGPEDASEEIANHRLLLHQHIIKLHEVLETPTDIYIVMEHADGGDLLEHVLGQVRLEEEEACRIFAQLVDAVDHCHGCGVAHRDIKVENILLNADLNIKLADFGLSGRICEDECMTRSCGSPNYAAPELLVKNCTYDGRAVDVWACGVVLYAILCSALPFDADNFADLYRQIKEGQYGLPGYLSGAAKDLISRMLTVDAQERISLAEVREHPWLHKASTKSAATDTSPGVAQNPQEDLLITEAPSCSRELSDQQEPVGASPVGVDIRDIIVQEKIAIPMVASVQQDTIVELSYKLLAEILSCACISRDCASVRQSHARQGRRRQGRRCLATVSSMPAMQSARNRGKHQDAVHAT